MQVPEGWSITKLEEISEIRSGSTPLRSKGERYFSNDGIPWVKTLDLNNARIEDTEEKITDLALQETSCSVFPVDTVLVAMYGGFNQIGRTGVLGMPAAINQALSALIIDNSKALSQYVLYFLNGNVKRWKQFAASSRKDPNITQSDVKNFAILLPPLAEQEKIAEILSTWDQTIEQTERLKTNAEMHKKALMQQLLTGKKRFPEFEGEWKEIRLGDVSLIDSGFAFKSQDFLNTSCNGNYVSVIRMSDLKSGILDREGVARVSKEITKGLDKYKLKQNDFVFGMSGSLSNYAWVMQHDLPCYLNQRVGRIRAKEGVNSLFIHYLYLSDKTKYFIQSIAAGAAQLNISIKDLRNLKVYIPLDLGEQQKIASVLNTADREIELLTQKIEHLKSEKRALMQQLLTGKRRVKVDG
ncbi:restriction endonuclease subunit S [Ignatzschineria cameli]|uniref:restriction endonuclease subunit S n=1 Tax=Ignatzschineria cameli TaxID=2182793 RepID=UPI000D60D08A|nr:restriction endonuclease subunit S [Ignatzschineria cameli]PWD85233.1 restriction endonuclease subunit S [Ignatzschineria cameli]